MGYTQRLIQVEYYRGSMLGPLLFSAFVSGLEEVTEGMSNKFAEWEKQPTGLQAGLPFTGI